MAIERFDGKYDFLSNFYLTPVPYQGIMYPSSEHAFQAAKTTNPAVRMEISEASTPGLAKKMGRRLELRMAWDDIRDAIMFSVLMEKFHNNPDICKKLLETGIEELVEGNTWGDTYWGVCNGNGKNKLGKLLMLVREEFRKRGRMR